MASLSLRVCSTCKARKKGCDKNLPTCGYCAKRGLVCRYSEPPAIEGHLPSATSAADFSTSILGLSLAADAETTLDQVVHTEVRQVLHRSGMSLDAITKRYFEGVHNWLPVVSPAHLHEAITNVQPGIPHADSSVLILTVCLVTINPSVCDSRRPIFLESLYVTAKTLFAQVQAVICASVHLVQAGLLITAYEYASGRPEAAYITIGTCARIGCSLGLGKKPSIVEGDIQSLHAVELWNVWWGIVILERYAHGQSALIV